MKEIVVVFNLKDVICNSSLQLFGDNKCLKLLLDSYFVSEQNSFLKSKHLSI